MFDPVWFDDDWFITICPETEQFFAAGAWESIDRTPHLKADKRTPENKFRTNRITVLQHTDSELTGEVQGQPASDIEERFARALDKAKIPYDFQISYLKPHNMAGEYRLDFIVYVNGLKYPYAIDGEFAHKTASQQRKDQFKDWEFNAKKRSDFQPVTRVVYYDLDTQEHANMYVREKILWRA